MLSLLRVGLFNRGETRVDLKCETKVTFREDRLLLIPGDKVLVLLPTDTNKLLLQWKGPYDVTRVVGPNDICDLFRNHYVRSHPRVKRLGGDLFGNQWGMKVNESAEDTVWLVGGLLTIYLMAYLFWNNKFVTFSPYM